MQPKNCLFDYIPVFSHASHTNRVLPTDLQIKKTRHLREGEGMNGGLCTYTKRALYRSMDTAGLCIVYYPAAIVEISFSFFFYFN